MLTQICQYLRNWFDRDKYLGRFCISSNDIRYVNGNILPLLSGQYFRIVGSLLNDGVYRYDAQLKLSDEEFEGAVWFMAIPKDIIQLDQDISDWIVTNAGAMSSPYQSESFGGYSYTLRTSGSNGSAGVTWQSQFESRLAPWRKI